MLLTVLEFLWWLQPEATGGGGGEGAVGGGGAGCAMQAGLFAVMMLIFYFFLLRPEQKRRREHEEMLRSIRKGTKVRTTGGLLGEVVTIDDDEVIIQIADRVRVNVLRSHIAAVEAARKAQGQRPAGKSAEKKDESQAKRESSDDARDEA